MKVVEAKFTKKFNTGNYESEEYSLGAIVEEKDKAVVVLQTLKTEVNAAFSGETAEAAPEKKSSVKKTIKKTEPIEVDEDEDEVTGQIGEDEEDDDEVAVDYDDTEAADDDEEEEEEEEAPPVKKKAASSPGKKFKKKEQVYSRTNEQHKELFSSTLRSVAPDWKKTEAGKAKAKLASQKMEGKAFLDENGEVIAEFKAEVKKLMAAKK